ncbi:MAG: ACT domain-containing protein [Terriglobales bacterium]
MAKTKQFTISLENRPGAVAEVARALGSAKVNILSLLATAQGPSGTAELVVEDARRARKALDDARITYRETTAEGYELPNKPGALADCLGKLAARGVNLNSICATASKGGRKAVLVYTVAAAEEKVAPAA